MRRQKVRSRSVTLGLYVRRACKSTDFGSYHARESTGWAAAHKQSPVTMEKVVVHLDGLEAGQAAKLAAKKSNLPMIICIIVLVLVVAASAVRD